MRQLTLRTLALLKGTFLVLLGMAMTVIFYSCLLTFLLIGVWIADLVCPTSTCMSQIFRPSLPSLPPQMPSVVSIPGYTPITTSNVGTIVELNSVDMNSKHAVIALDIASDNNVAMAVTSWGRVVRFSLDRPTRVITNDVEPMTLNLRATTLNAQLGILATGMKYLESGWGSNWEAHVWDIRNGTFVTIASSYNDPPTTLAMTPDAKWLVVANQDLFVDEISTGNLTRSERFRYQSSVDRIEALAFDPAGEYLAVANANGSIAIVHLNPSGELEIWKSTTLEMSAFPTGSVDYQAVKPLGLAFDTTRKQLAMLRDNEAIVYDLGAWRQTLKVTVTSTTGPAGSVAFDPSGQLLAVGTQDGWQMWDVAHSKKLFEQVGAGTYTVAFSADGRAFVWGDLDGHVHIWVARQ